MLLLKKAPAAKLIFYVFAAAFVFSCSDKEPVSQASEQTARNRPVPERPDVVLISLDTTRADHLGCYGYFRPTTPNLDRFAEKCARFEQAESPSNITLSAHASMFSSLYPREHRAVANNWPVRQNVPLLPEVLARHGWQCFAAVAAYPLDAELGLSRGFHIYDDDYNVDEMKNPELWFRPGDEVVAAVEKALKKRDPARPLFLFVHFWEAHSPYYSAPENRKFFKTDERLKKWTRERQCKPFAENRINRYDAALRTLDDRLGELFALLKREGILDRGLVIVTADHGEGLGQHDFWGHSRHIYESQTHVPLLIRFPRGKHAGKVIKERVSTLDLAPTIYDFLNITPPRKQRGISLMPIIEGKDPPRPRAIFIKRSWFPPEKPEGAKKWEPGETFAVVKDDYKLIWHSAKPLELYNLAVDPFELHNLAEEEKDTAARLLPLIEEHRKLVGPVPAEKAPRLSPKTERALKALGYLQ